MGKVNYFSLVFNSNRNHFYSGEKLTGHVVLQLNSPKEVKGILIKLKGESYCHWTEVHGSGEKRRTEHYKGQETLCNLEYTVFGMQAGGSRKVLPVGQSKFPFVIQIPDNLPSSFEGNIGYIRYHISATLKTGKLLSSDEKTKNAIKIYEFLDPNSEDNRKARNSNDSKFVGIFCCASGPLDMGVGIDRRCYYPGEDIAISGVITNNTKRKMGRSKVKLVQTITYITPKKTKVITNVVARKKGPRIPRGGTDTWNKETLNVKNTLPPTIDNSVIKVSYYFQMKVNVPWGIDLRTKFPVLVGTVPFYMGSGQYISPIEQQEELNEAYINSAYDPGEVTTIVHHQTTVNLQVHQQNTQQVNSQYQSTPEGYPHPYPQPQAYSQHQPAGYPQNPPLEGYPQHYPQANFPQHPPPIGYPQYPPTEVYSQNQLPAEDNPPPIGTSSQLPPPVGNYEPPPYEEKESQLLPTKIENVPSVNDAPSSSNDQAEAIPAKPPIE